MLEATAVLEVAGLDAGYGEAQVLWDVSLRVEAREIVALVRDKIGPVAAFKTVLTVNRLPKTRSGKILRGTMRKIADGEQYKMPATIDDPAILAEITTALKAKGFPSAPSDAS